MGPVGANILVEADPGQHTECLMGHDLGAVQSQALPFMLALSLAVVCDARADDVVFGGVVTSATSFSESVNAVHLDDDGALDLVIVGEDEIVVFLGDGCGGFNEHQRIVGGDAGLVVKDVTGDSLLDLVVGAFSGCEISIYPGVGGGLFGARTPIPSGCGPATVVAHDFNGDGIVDIATGNEESQSISVLYGIGKGAFGSANTIPTGINDGIGAITSADIDLDGDIDFVSAGGDSVTIHRNEGGAFPVRTSIGAGLTPRSVQVGDLNDDNRMDIVVANAATNRVSILRQFAPGLFLPPATVTVGASPERMLLADLDQDGALDIVVAHPSTIIEIGNPNEDAPEGSVGLFGGEVRVLRNSGAGLFTESDRFFAGAWPRAFDVGDFNGDGELDLVTASRVLPAFTSPFIVEGGADTNAVGFVSVAFGLTDATFAAAERVLSAGASRIKLGDVDNDGDLDLFEGRAFGYLVRRNNGDGRFDALVGGVDVTGLPLLDPSFDIGPINDDSRLDILTASSEGLKVAFGNGSGFFAPFEVVDEGGYRAVALVDLNGDGELDAVGAVPTTEGPDQAIALLGDGLGGFTRVDSTDLPKDPYMAIVADFNGDAKPDVAFACRDSKTVAVTFLDDAGQFSNVSTMTLPGVTQGIRAADVDRDGDLDIVAASFSLTGGAVIFLNDGEGQFTFDQQVGSFSDVPDVEAMDFNLDHWPDVLVPDAERDRVHIYLNDHLGGFEYAGAFVAGDYPRSLGAGDVNGDDRADVVIAGMQSETGPPGLQTFASVMSHFNASIGPATVGDLTGEGVVGAADLAALLQLWGNCPAMGACSGDLNADGVVNGIDLALLLANWS